MPVLQLVGGMLATLGPKHSTAAHQVTSVPLFYSLIYLSVVGGSRFPVKSPGYYHHPFKERERLRAPLIH